MKAGNPSIVEKNWNNYQLPLSMNNKSFLDVGTWAGGFCIHAKKLNASDTLGIDIICPQKQNFNFLQCDIFSEKYLEIQSFDIVLCAGVLYHVENVISLLYRLKIKTKQKLVLETEIVKSNNSILHFCKQDTFKNNFSNWWVPSISCVFDMLEACEFKNINIVFEKESRACFHAEPKNKTNEKILSRKKEWV